MAYEVRLYFDPLIYPALYRLFQAGIRLDPWILSGEPGSDILNFDFDAFITAVIRYQYNYKDCMTPVFRTSSVVRRGMDFK